MGFEIKKLGWTLLVLQFVFALLFHFFVDYDDDVRPKSIPKGNNSAKEAAAIGAGAGEKNSLHDYYGMFQDVHVMIFIGFGFLMVFLRRYGFSSVGFNMLISVMAIQWATLVSGFIHYKGDTIHMGVTSMLTADFASAAVLITFGALLGKTSALQMVVVALLEIVFFSANEYIGITHLKVVDVGGSMFVHAFGAYFGLTVSRVIARPGMDSSQKEGSVYHSDLFAMIGTLFLWMFWPSFNSALAVGDAQHRAVLNTYLALAACCMTSFSFSSQVDKKGKFDMVHIQNATLAGGVAVGTCADMMIQPSGAIWIGMVAGIISVFGYKYLSPLMASKLKIHDTCGVNNLHGMPALLAGITGAIVVSMADKDTYGYTLYRQFPAMAPTNASSPEWADFEGHVEFVPGEGRSAGEQAGYQMIALVVTLAFAVVGGLIVGLILRFCPFLDQPIGPTLFEDDHAWEVPEDSNNEELVNDVLVELTKRGKGDHLADQSTSPLLQLSVNDDTGNGTH